MRSKRQRAASSMRHGTGKSYFRNDRRGLRLHIHRRRGHGATHQEQRLHIRQSLRRIRCRRSSMYLRQKSGITRSDHLLCSGRCLRHQGHRTHHPSQEVKLSFSLLDSQILRAQLTPSQSMNGRHLSQRLTSCSMLRQMVRERISRAHFRSLSMLLTN